MELGERKKGKESDRASVISHAIRCVLKAAEKQGVGGKGVRESFQKD
jgi:hypothetical protein